MEISAPGHEKKTVAIKSRMSGWYMGNLFFGGLVGLLIVDPLTGGMWALPQEEVGVGLTPSGKVKTASATKTGLEVVTLDKVPLHLRGKMQRLAYVEN